MGSDGGDGSSSSGSRRSCSSTCGSACSCSCGTNLAINFNETSKSTKVIAAQALTCKALDFASIVSAAGATHPAAITLFDLEAEAGMSGTTFSTQSTVWT